jgi:hypothetical protein
MKYILCVCERYFYKHFFAANLGRYSDLYCNVSFLCFGYGSWSPYGYPTDLHEGLSRVAVWTKAEYCKQITIWENEKKFDLPNSWGGGGGGVDEVKLSEQLNLSFSWIWIYTQNWCPLFPALSIVFLFYCCVISPCYREQCTPPCIVSTSFLPLNYV